MADNVTIVGVFPDWPTATGFRNRLLQQGIAESAIRTTPKSDAYAQTTHMGDEDKGFWQSLKELFTGEDEHEAHSYAEATRRGGILVAAQVPEARVTEITQLMKQHRAIDVQGRAAQWRQQGWTGYDEKRPALSANELRTAREQDSVIPVVQEQIAVGKREVQGGGVRVLRRVIETPVEQDVTLRSEHVDVQRKAVDRPLTGTDVDKAFKDQTLELTEKHEEAVVSKTARVVEEITVNKGVEQHTEKVRDTVRKTDVQVEKLPPGQTTTGTTSTTKTTDDARTTPQPRRSNI